MVPGQLHVHVMFEQHNNSSDRNSTDATHLRGIEVKLLMHISDSSSSSRDSRRLKMPEEGQQYEGVSESQEKEVISKVRIDKLEGELENADREKIAELAQRDRTGGASGGDDEGRRSGSIDPTEGSGDPDESARSTQCRERVRVANDKRAYEHNSRIKSVGRCMPYV